jgi:hypothetical protein
MSYLRSLSALLLTLAALNGRAQSTEDSVKAAVNTLFTAMKKADSAGIMHAFTDSAMLQSEAPGHAGGITLHTSVPLFFAHRAGAMGPGVADERIHIDLLRIDGPLAMIWAPYSFFLNGKFHHCGVDTFQLIRTADGWKIQYVLYTTRASGCPVGTPDAP